MKVISIPFFTVFLFFVSMPLSFAQLANADAFLLVGQEKHESGAYKESVAALTKAIQLNPKLEDAYFCRAKAFIKLGEQKKAIKDLDVLIGRNENNLVAISLRGDAFYQAKEYKKAIRDFTRVLQDTPEDMIVCYSRGLAKAESGDYQGALQDFNRLLDGDGQIEGVTEFTGGYLSRGDTKHKLGDNTGACADWKTAFEKGDGKAAIKLEKHCK
jgi:tetratricopeptide (TPR) repeat protein